MKIYVAMKQGNDYDCDAPWTEVVAGKGYKTREEAFAAIEADIESELNGASPDDVFEDYGAPSKKGHGKYGVVYFSDCDGTITYDIEEIEVDA